jgi:ABC-type proline/glycine betaine transport system permease subunit
MADPDRRGEEHEHAWAELTFINFFKFILIAWAVGIVCGVGFFAIGIYTTIYQGLLGSVWLFMQAYPALDVFGIALLVLFVYVMVKINGPKRKKVGDKQK